MRKHFRFSSIAALAMLAGLGCLDTALGQTLTFSPGTVTINASSNGISQTATGMLSITSGTSPFTIASSSTCSCMATNPSMGTATTTAQNILVIVNPTGVGAGSYTGTLTITAAGATNSPLMVSVTINIGSSGNATIQVSPSPLPAFSLPSASSATSTQQLTVFSINGSTAFSDAFAFSTGPTSAPNIVTLDISSGVASPTSVINVTAHPSGLPDGTYTGTVTVTPTNGSPVLVAVTVNIGSLTGVSASPPSLTPSVTAGAQSVTLNVSITNNTGSAVMLTPSVLTTSCGAGWLTSSPNVQFTVQSGTPFSLSVIVNPATFANGTCEGSVTLTPGGGGSALTIPVTVTVGSGGAGTFGLAAIPTSILDLSAAMGGAPGTKPLQITATVAGPAAISASAMTSNGNSTWLVVTPTFVNTLGSASPANLTVKGDPTGLAAGTYNGSITITGFAFNGGTIVVPVTFTVGGGGGGSPAISAVPTSLSVTVPTGSTTPISPTLQVTTLSTTNVGVTATTNTNGTGAWLTVSPANIQFANSTTPINYTVTVSPAAFVGTGPFSGNVVLTPQTGSAVVVPVTIIIGNGTLKVTPAQLSFAFQTGTAFPVPQNLTLTSTGTALSFSAIVTTQSGGSWLTINNASGNTGANGAPATLIVSVNPAGLAAGLTYTGNIAITSGNTTINVPVTLLVSTLSVLTLSSGQNTFNYQIGSATFPPAQTVQVTSSGNPISFTLAVDNSGPGGAFLNVAPSSGTTPQTLVLSLNPAVLATLAAGTYSTTVSLTGVGSGNSPASIKVTLVVGQNSLLNASQGSLAFNYQLGQSAPPVQALNLTSSGTALAYTVTATSTNCGNFLSASPATGTTPGSTGVAVNITGLTAGVCTGVVHITSPTAGNSPLEIPVTLYDSNAALLNVSPSAINVTTTVGSNPASVTLSLASTDLTVLGFSVTSQTNDGAGWLTVGPTGGSTPNSLTVSFTAAALAAKTYTGSITIASMGPANAPVVIPVTLTVTSLITAAAAPASLTFNQAFGGSAPPSQTLQVTTSTTGQTFSSVAATFNGGNWLTVTGSGTTPGSVTVAANGPSLMQGVYNGIVTITVPGASNSPLQVGVTLVVGPAQTLLLGASSLTFNYNAGSVNTPPAQTVSVTSTGGSVPFSATANGNFITVNPATGATPGSVSVGMNQAVLSTLAAGPYTGTVTVSSPGLPNQTITVNLTVAAQVAPVINLIVNGASLLAGSLSPGEVVTIFGTNIGPTPSQTYQITSGGLVSNNLGNTTVMFDTFLAPLLFVSANQINAIVPYEVAGRLSTSVVVTRNGVASAPLVLRTVDTAPAIFSLTQTGSGQGAILNQNFTINGVGNAASKGTVISIYATGEGLVSPNAVTGSFTGLTPPFPRPTALPVGVTIGGLGATITYAGEAPTLVSGVLQVNAIVPTALVGTGPFTVLLTVGANTSTQPITVQVQ